MFSRASGPILVDVEYWVGLEEILHYWCVLSFLEMWGPVVWEVDVASYLETFLERVYPGSFCVLREFCSGVLGEYWGDYPRLNLSISQRVLN